MTMVKREMTFILIVEFLKADIKNIDHHHGKAANSTYKGNSGKTSQTYMTPPDVTWYMHPELASP